VQRAYQTLIMVGRFPIIALFITVNPEDVDVNVHPAKAEVRFKNQDRIVGGVHRAIRRGLVTQSPVPELNTPTAWPSYRQESVPRFDPNGQGVPTAEPLWRSNLMSNPEPENVPDQDMPSQVSRPGPAVYQPFMPQPSPVTAAENGLKDQDIPETSPVENLPEALPKSVPPLQTDSKQSAPFFPILRWIGQIGATFIIAEGPDGLYLIDQHAAHERILYEKMLDAEASGTIVSQTLLEPAVVQLPPWQASALEENMPVLKHLGFEIEEFGPNAFRIISMPAIFEKGSPAAAIAAVVEDLENDNVPMQGLTSERIASYVCKRMAVKAGQTLTTEEQRALIRDLEQCRSPRTCPHGRPTMIHLSIDLLEKQFGRKGAF
jgi:DNA mismatch repair protein MutL